MVILRKEKDKLDVILIATGSEVHLAYEAAKTLEDQGVGARVVSMPSMELFDQQSEEYKNEVLPKNITKRVAIEAGSSFGWHKYTGFEGKIISIDTFGASAPANLLFKKFNLTVDNVVNTALSII